MRTWAVGIGTAIALAAGVIGDAGAVTRFWALQGVQFADGGTATGSFGYDNTSGQFSSWNVRVQGAPGCLPFTYVPGDSLWESYPGSFLGLGVYATGTVVSGDARVLYLSVDDDLDGSPAVVPLKLTEGAGSVSNERCGATRTIVAGSLVLVPFPPPVGLVDVIEFYHAAFNHYFMSADPVEINALDTGYFTGWARTGYQFKAYATGSSAGPSQNPVCRYYGLPSAGIDSHFYSADPVECYRVNRDYGTEWQIESDNVFQIDLPDRTTGACPGGTVPVYRVFNGHHDANHRYTTSAVVRAQMEAAGWIREGYGPDATIMCAVGAP